MSEITEKHRECAEEIGEGLYNYNQNQYSYNPPDYPNIPEIIAKHFPAQTDAAREPVAWLCQLGDKARLTRLPGRAHGWRDAGWTVTGLCEQQETQKQP